MNDFFIGLNHRDETVTIEFHLNRLAAATTEKSLQRNVGFEVRLERSRPRDRRIGIGSNRMSRADKQCDRLKMRGDGDQTRTLNSDIE